ncbi:MAG TPA: c-type cytochrome [Candidatus Binataceae bacterium]|nr:c-type cytochrome [Candidatus Binataceae bacterium]
MSLTTPSRAAAFPWSTDMFVGAAVQPLEMAPRVMPDGTLPVDGIHYNIHYGQPEGMPNGQAIPPMKLELMTVRLHNPLQPSVENLAHGKVLFQTVCGPCHGITGQGNGSVVHLLQHKPANLLTGVSSNLPDGYVYGYIRNGGIWMPSYDDAMSSTERWQIVLYVRALEKKYGGTEAKAGQNQPASAEASASEGGPYQPNEMASGRSPEQAGRNGLIAEPALFQPGLDESGTGASLGTSQSQEVQQAGNSGKTP